MQELAPLRQEIDALDGEIVALLAKRLAVVERVIAVKSEHDIPVILPERIEQVVERAAASGASMGADADFVRTVYRSIIDATCAYEEKALRPS